MLPRQQLLSLVLLAVPLVACSTGKSSRAERFSGFLSTYEDLEEDPDVPGNYRTPREGMDLSKYSKVYLAPIEIWPDPEADYGGLSITDAQRVADDFLLEFNRALGSDYPLTNSAGPGVLYLRIAITDLVPSSPLRSWKRWWGGSGASTRGANAEFENPHLNISGMTIEAEAFDSETGERLYATVQARSTGRGRAGQQQTWDSVQNDLAAWAQALRAALDRAHGR